MSKYRKKPVVIEAVMADGHALELRSGRVEIPPGTLLTEFRFTGSAGELRSLADQLEAVADRVDELGEAFAKATGAAVATEPEPDAGDAPKE